MLATRTVPAMFGILAILVGAGSARAAGGAYAVDDAAIGKVGDCQIESWVSSARNGDFIGVTQPACVVDVGLPVEITTLAQWLRVDGDSVGVVGMQGKLVLPAQAKGIAVALVVGATYDLTVGQSALTFVNMPLSVELNDRLRVNFNTGWLHDALLEDDHLTWGAGFEWDFVKSVTLIGEIYGQTNHFSDPRAQAGVRYSPRANVDLDLIGGHNITGEQSRWLTAGATFRF